MNITKQLSGAGATEQMLRQFEAMANLQLPSDYRAFMSEFNGGRPEFPGFPVENQGKADAAIRYFLTMDSREPRYTVERFLAKFCDRIPIGMIPIACDPLGNLVLMQTTGSSHGSIYFWDHELFDDDEPAAACTEVAPSFSAFIKMLLPVTGIPSA